MTDPDLEDPVPTSKSKLKNRLTFLAIIAIFVLPFFILPLIMSPEQMNKTNKGFLIQPPVSFADLQLVDSKKITADISLLGKKWSMVYFVPAMCDTPCVSARTNALYSMRQVRLTLQRDMDRVQTLLVFTMSPDDQLAALLDKEFPGMLRMQVSSVTLDKQIDKASTAGNIYLMSPDGYIFIYYPPHENEQESILHAEDMRADLKKSIKGSRL